MLCGFALSCVATASSPDVPVPELFATPFRIEPAPERIRTLPSLAQRWWIPEHAARDFSGLGLRDATAAELLERLKQAPGTSDRWVGTDVALLAQFTAEERAAWHRLLAEDPRNRWHRWPVVVSSELMRRLAAQPAWAAAQRRIESVGIPAGESILFCDPAALEGTFESARDMRAFFQELFSAETLLVKVVSRRESLDAGANRSLYWHVHGRYRAIEPFMNAVAAVPDHERIDVAHMLPRLPRSLLYSYPPSLADAEDPDVEGGMLAMDFFSGASPAADEPPAPDLATWLGRDCVRVDRASQYGDVLVFEDPAHRAWPYAVVHLADGIVFGRRPVAFGPWVFMHVDEVARLNPRLGGQAPQVFRRRRALPPVQPPAYVRDRAPLVWRRQLSLRPLPEGPWGRLWAYDVLLAPPGDVLESLPPPSWAGAWVFDRVPDGTVKRALSAVEDPETRDCLSQLFREAVPDAQGRRAVRPTLELALATPAGFREVLFPYLVGGLGASDPVQFIPFPTEIPIEQWFDTGSMPPAAREALLRLAYPVRGGFAISDWGVLYHVLENRAERLAAQRAALRVPALVLLLEKPAPAEIPALARYWSRSSGRNIERMLQSFAATEDMRYLDVVHLLPPVAREFLNTYFLTDTVGPTPSCLWTAFNFGAEVPDQRFLVLPDTWTEDGDQAWMELMSSYQWIPEPSQLGDVIVYRRLGAESVLHACTFVAGGVVYTKNGFTFSAPWHLARSENVDALYLLEGVEKVFFRRR